MTRTLGIHPYRFGDPSRGLLTDLSVVSNALECWVLASSDRMVRVSSKASGVIRCVAALAFLLVFIVYKWIRVVITILTILRRASHHIISHHWLLLSESKKKIVVPFSSMNGQCGGANTETSSRRVQGGTKYFLDRIVQIKDWNGSRLEKGARGLKGYKFYDEIKKTIYCVLFATFCVAHHITDCGVVVD